MYSVNVRRCFAARRFQLGQLRDRDPQRDELASFDERALDARCRTGRHSLMIPVYTAVSIRHDSGIPDPRSTRTAAAGISRRAGGTGAHSSAANARIPIGA